MHIFATGIDFQPAFDSLVICVLGGCVFIIVLLGLIFLATVILGAHGSDQQ
jgi:hypothetical protein